MKEYCEKRMDETEELYKNYFKDSITIEEHIKSKVT
jgi:hypothetical protein